MKTDILIIGGGVVGAAVAYRLCRYRLSVAWVEKENDICTGTSKANSSMIHDGYNVDGSKLKGKLVLKSHPLYAQMCRELHIPYTENVGSVVVGFKDEDMNIIKEQLDMGTKNGIRGLQIVDRNELLKMEPNLDPKARFGLYNPNTGVVDPFQLTLAMAENAVTNGVKFCRNTEVISIQAQNGKISSVETTAGRFEPKVVINAAGLYSDRIAAMAEEIDFSVRPQRGQYFLYDREWQGHVKHCIYSSPTKTSKGMIILPTIEGNILAGSNAIAVKDKEDVATTRQETEDIYWNLIHRHFPKLPRMEGVITSFVGLRAVSNTEDFIISHARTVRGLINLVGIQSPGLSSAPGIAEMVEKLARELELDLDFREKEFFRTGRPRPIALRNMTNEERAAMIAKNPDYGTIICRCEMISKGEILDALNGPIPAMDLDGVKRRARAGMGRCQGGFCGPKVMDLLRKKLKVSLLEITKKGPGSNILSKCAKRTVLPEGSDWGEKVLL